MTKHSTHQPAPRRLRGDDDGGYVLIMTGLLLVPLMVMTAFAVDLGGWYAQATKIQRAADAASLAGVPYVGTDVNRAIQLAKDTAADNGYSTGVTVTPVGTDRLQVSIASQGAIFFSRAGGINSEPLNRSATAQFIPGVPMGSPGNYAGTDPDLGINPNYWLTNGSYQTSKINGDRYNTSRCDTPSGAGPTTMYGCNGNGVGQNFERLPDGYTYSVHNTGTGSGNLDIQVYDAQYSQMGGFCDDNMPTSTQLATLATQWGGTYSNISNRWGVGGGGANTANMAYCPGDDNTALTAAGRSPDTPSLPTDAIQPMDVTYIVRAPDLTPTNYLDNPPICAITFGGKNTNVWPLLDTAQQGNTNLAPENVKFASHFHNWFTICDIPAAQVVTGDYIVQVKTTADQSNLGATPKTTATAGLNIGTLNNNTTPSTAGMQRYAIRTGWSIPTNASSVTSTGLNIFANGQLPIYAHGTTNQFFDLARITPQFAGSTLVFDFWDIGDGANESINVTTPPDATNPPTVCSWTRDTLSSMANAVVSGCTVSNMTNGDFNGRLTSAKVTIPTNYTCNSSDPNGCWFGVNIGFSNGTPTDTTTWTARVLGNPVRLVQ
jgi:hypothetical protein